MTLDFGKALVLDSGNKVFRPEMTSLFPEAEINAVGEWGDYVPNALERPHYHHVAHCLLKANPYAKVDVGAYLRYRGQWEALLSCIENSDAGFVNLSLGQDFTEAPENYLDQQFWWGSRKELAKRFPELLDAIGPDRFVFLSCGNYDESERGRPDMSNDLNEWAHLTHDQENWFDIAACTPEGIPETYSSDSVEYPAEVCYVGNVWVIDPHAGEWLHRKGTSFSGPSACGHAMSLMRTGAGYGPTGDQVSFGPGELTFQHLRNFWEYWARRPKPIEGHPVPEYHRKAGVGVFLERDYVLQGGRP